MDKVVMVLVGIPGSGKSTMRKQLVAEKGAVYVNKDDIRNELTAKYGKKGLPKRGVFEKETHDVYEDRLKALLNHGHALVVVDNTNLNQRDINYVETLAKSKGYVCDVHYLTDSLNVELCHKRNMARAHSEHVPPYVIENMAEKFINLYFKNVMAKGVDVKKSRQKAIIVDMDGTLAHMTSGRKAYDWMRVGEDTLDQTVLDLVNFYKSTGHAVIICSGRDGVCEDITRGWLVKHNVPFDHFFIRTPNDMRKDTVVKLELYANHIMADFDVKVCLDDRLQVVRAWRGVGLKCLQVESGWF